MATLKKIGQGIGFVVLAIITVYCLYVFSGLFMVILLAATAPVTMAWESLTLDYTVWIIAAFITLLPFGFTIASAQTNRYRILRRSTLFLLPFLVGGSLLIFGAMLLPWPAWAAPAVPIVATLLIVVGFYWYVKKIRPLILK